VKIVKDGNLFQTLLKHDALNPHKPPWGFFMTLEEAKHLILVQRSRIKGKLFIGSMAIWKIDLAVFPPEIREDVSRFLDHLNVIDSTDFLRQLN
jgi:hypothetical protein